MNLAESLKTIAEAGWAAIAPVLVVMIGIYGRPLLNAAIVWLNAKTKVVMSERDVALLQSALGNAAWSMGSKVFGDKAVITQMGVDYLKTSVPDLARKLEVFDPSGNPDLLKVEKLIAPHVERVRVARTSGTMIEDLARRDNISPGSTLEGKL